MGEYICPHCGKPIYDDDALMCLYCGDSLDRGVGTLGKIRYSVHWSVFVFVVILLLLILLIYFFR